VVLTRALLNRAAFNPGGTQAGCVQPAALDRTVINRAR
jgi:hypothetical protein